MIDWMSKAAQFKFNLPKEWQWAKCEAVHGGFIVEGNILNISKRGKKTFTKPLEKYIITNNDLILCKRDYELKTGKCSGCEGAGKICYGWDSVNGHLYRPCEKCKGKGAIQ